MSTHHHRAGDSRHSECQNGISSASAPVLLSGRCPLPAGDVGQPGRVAQRHLECETGAVHRLEPFRGS
jgi:hypothetical protein